MTQQRQCRNVLLITSDQQHWNTIGAWNPHVKTPNLDALVEAGTTFTRAYCPNPTCTPTRASIITGLYPSQHGAYSLGTKLPEDVPTIGDILQQQGYRTSLIGKAHFQPLRETKEVSSLESLPRLHDLDFWRQFHGPFYGFEHVELVRNHTNEHIVGQHYAAWMEDNGLPEWRRYFDAPVGTMDPGAKHVWELPEPYHYNAWIGQRTSLCLAEHAAAQEPFFLWASFPDPHPPYFVPEPWASMYNPDDMIIPDGQQDEHQNSPPHFGETQKTQPDFSRYAAPDQRGGIHGFHSHVQDEASLRGDIAIYYGMISMMDHYIGQIFDTLKQQGLAEDTLVVFTTDHGHRYGHHDLIAKGPFHYEDLIRVPLVIRQPGTIPAGQRRDSLQSLVDLAPTFLSSLGLPIPRTMTGVDQRPVWTGAVPTVRDHIIVENRHQPDTMNLKTFVNQRYKLTVYFGQDYGEMYDLQEDPGEQQNLWQDPEHQECKTQLLQQFLWAEMGKEPLWMPRIWGA